MGYPESEEIQGCANTFTGPMGGAGWVREVVCGETPDVRVPAERAQYFEDPNNPGNYHLYGFGIITGISQEFNPNQQKTRGIGSRDIHCNRAGQFETSLEITYNPTDLGRIPFITGIDADIQALEAPVCLGDCLPYSSIETWYERDCPSENEIRWLHNMMLLDTFSNTVTVGEFVEWSESLMGQYQQRSSSKLYTPPIQSVQVGLDPLDPCCDAFMAHDGDIYMMLKQTENVSSQIQAGGTSIFTLAKNAADFNRDGVIDGNLATFNNKLCWRDVEVYVDGSKIADDLITVSTINSKFVNIGMTVTPGQTVVIYYYYMRQLWNVTAYDFEIAWNAVQARGIWKGLPVPYELQNAVRDITGNVTQNFKDAIEYDQMKADEFFHLFFEQGGISDTPIVWQLLFAKWDSVNPPFQEDDLIAVQSPYQAMGVCIDNQIRLPPDGSAEEGEGEGGGGGPTDYFPLINGFN